MHAARTIRTGATRVVALFLLVVAVGVALAAPARAAEPALKLTALTGPQGGTLTIELTPALRVLERVHVRLLAPGATEVDMIHRTDVVVREGVATIGLGPVVRGTRLDVQAQVKLEASPRTLIVRGTTTARLRPDLVVTAVHAPPQTLSTRPIDVVADVSEVNGDTAATARLTLMLGPTPIAEPEVVTVPAGETVTATFAAVELPTPMAAELTVRVEDAAPFETDETNNTRTRTVQVTEHELVRSNVLVSGLGGYGAQLNQHVYAPVTNAPPGSFGDLEEKVKALEPQLVRIFYNDLWEERRPEAPQNLASFVETVRLAQEAGATINITYQTATVARLQPTVSMARFAGVLEELVEQHGLANVRWVTIQNEPNTAGAALTLAQYEALYRALNAELTARGLRDHIKLMGGDLIEGAGERHHTIWFEYMAEHMSDVLDAYSVHIYWNYWDIPRMEFRLRDVRRIVTALDGEARKPTFITEMGVRGIIGHARQSGPPARPVGRRHAVRPDEHLRLSDALVRPRRRATRLLRLGQVGRVLGQVRLQLRRVALSDRPGGRGLAAVSQLSRATTLAPDHTAGLGGRPRRPLGGGRLADRCPRSVGEGARGLRERRRPADVDGARYART